MKRSTIMLTLIISLTLFSGCIIYSPPRVGSIEFQNDALMSKNNSLEGSNIATLENFELKKRNQQISLERKAILAGYIPANHRSLADPVKDNVINLYPQGNVNSSTRTSNTSTGKTTQVSSKSNSGWGRGFTR